MLIRGLCKVAQSRDIYQIKLQSDLIQVDREKKNPKRKLR